MLVLTRRLGETIVAGENIRFYILSISGNQVRVGIDAPKEVKINRLEIHKKIQEEKTQGNMHVD